MEIRLGTIGSNFIVHNILRHVVKTPGFTYTAAYSRSAEKARALADQYGAKRSYSDMDAFLADEEVNFVYIAVPNSLHFQTAKAALLAGKNVLLEKPFCPELAEAEELVELAKARGLILADMTPTAYLPNLPVLKEQLPKIGQIRLVMGNYTQYSSRYDRFRAGEQDNVFTAEFAGGSLMDINYYNVYLNTALFGKASSARYFPNIQRGIDTSGVIVLEYDGFVSQNAGAKDCRGENFFQIEGEDGSIFVPGGVSCMEQIRVVTREGTETFGIPHESDLWGWVVKELARIIGSDDLTPLEEGLNTMLGVIGTIERARKDAKIFFPGDRNPQRPSTHREK